MQLGEIRAALSQLPQTVKYRQQGKTVIIESPGEFEAWLHSERHTSDHWLHRLRDSLPLLTSR